MNAQELVELIIFGLETGKARELIESTTRHGTLDERRVVLDVGARDGAVFRVAIEQTEPT